MPDWIDSIVNRWQERGSLGASAATQNDTIGKVLSAIPILSGNGSPVNTVKAPVGSLYTRLDGGANTTLYVKESGGTGSSGWVAK